MNVGSLWVSLGLDTKAFKAGMAGAAAQMKQTGMAMQSVGKSMSMYLTAPLTLIGGASFKVFKDWESNLSKITGLVGIAKDQVDAWKDSIMQISVATGQGPEKLASAMFFITSAGLRGQDVLDALEVSAKAAASGLGEVEVIADLVTSAMNAYGSDTLNAAQATDVLVAAVREGKASAESISGALGGVLPIASAMGVSFDEVGASIAAMTRTGTEAANASTQLKAILASLLAPTKQAEDALNMMGTSSAELRHKIKNEGLLAVLTDLKDIQGQYGDEALATVIPNIRALSGVLDLVGGNAEANIAVFKALEDTTGALDAAFEEASQTSEFKMDKAMAQLKTSMISIGEQVKTLIIPLIEKLGQKAQQLGEWFENLSEGQKKLTVGLAAMAAAAGPLLMVFGSFLQKLPVVINGFKNLMKVMKNMSSTMKANVYLATAAAVVAISIALIKWHRNANKVETAQRKLNKSVQAAQVEIKLQQQAMNDLFVEIKKSNEGTDERKKLIDKMNDTYGDYLPNLLTEKSTLDEISNAQKTANAELAKGILLKAKSAAIEEELTAIFEDQTKQLNKIRDGLLDSGQSTEFVDWALADYIRRLREGENAYGAFQASIGKVSGAYVKFEGEHKKITKLIGEERQVIDSIAGAYDALISSFEMGLPTPDAGGGGGDGGGGGGVSEDVMTSYEKLNDEISRIQNKLQNMATDMQRGIFPEGEDYRLAMSKLYTELEKLQDIKEQVDADLFDSGQELLKGVKNNFYAMSDARKKFGMTELQLLEESQNAQLSALDNSLANMEVVFQGNEEKILELQSYYAGLRKKVLEEYALEKERIENASLKKTQDNLKQELSAVEESLMSQEERAEQTWQNRVDIIDQAVEAGVISMEEGNRLIIKSTEDLNEALKTSANEMGVLGSTWSDTANQIGDSIATMVEDMVAHLATATMAFTEAFFTFGTSAKEGESRVDKFRAASEALGVGLLGTFTTMMEQVGGIIIKAGIAAFAIGKAFQEALKNPTTALLAVSAGAALIAVAKGVQNSLQGLATGGIVTSGGVFKVGEEGEELVTLPRGSAVTPNHMLSGTQGGYIASTRIAGRDLEILIERSAAQTKRR